MGLRRFLPHLGVSSLQLYNSQAQVDFSASPPCQLHHCPIVALPKLRLASLWLQRLSAALPCPCPKGAPVLGPWWCRSTCVRWGELRPEPFIEEFRRCVRLAEREGYRCSAGRTCAFAWANSEWGCPWSQLLQGSSPVTSQRRKVSRYWLALLPRHDPTFIGYANLASSSSRRAAWAVLMEQPSS